MDTNNLTLLVASILCVCLFLEGFFRIISPKSPEGTTYGKTIKYNSDGFRNRESSIPKPENTFRIVVLGDSFTWGVGLDLEETVPLLVESNMQRKYPSLEVVNAAVPDDNTVRQLDRFKRAGLKYEPNLVLLIYNLNDIEFIADLAMQNDDTNKAVSVFQDERESNWKKYSQKQGLRGLIYSFQRQSKFIEFLVPRIGTLLRQLDLLNSLEFSWVQKTLEGFTDDNPGWVKSKGALKELHDVSSRQNIQLLVAIHPLLVADADRVKQKRVHEVILRYLSEINVPALDLLPVFDGRTMRDFWINYMDSHPNKDAHQLVARELMPFLEKYMSLSKVEMLDDKVTFN
jgi:lysophospholipase L1-like esterase